jgi:hypothetical protein
MSYSDLPPTPPAPPVDPAVPPERRGGCLTALMVIIGIILLLPGACALIFGYVAIGNRDWPSDITGLIIFGLLIGAGGIWLIVRAFRH